jgi:serine/threonine protein kinase
VSDADAQAADDAELHAHVEGALRATYELESEIGRGGMGIVYRARDKRLKRPVAIKLLPPELSFRRDVRSRFLREAETAAQLSHPNIVPIYSVDEVGNLVFFVMACIDGDNLARQLHRRGPLPIAEVRRWLLEVGEALAYAHARGVIHRDIKPDNIFLARTAKGVVPKVIDFGIARVIDDEGASMQQTALGEVMGTAYFMSPEQARGDTEVVDGRSDVWSLGAVNTNKIMKLLLRSERFDEERKRLEETAKAKDEEFRKRYTELETKYKDLDPKAPGFDAGRAEVEGFFKEVEGWRKEMTEKLSKLQAEQVEKAYREADDFNLQACEHHKGQLVVVGVCCRPAARWRWCRSTRRSLVSPRCRRWRWVPCPRAPCCVGPCGVPCAPLPWTQARWWRCGASPPTRTPRW